MLKLKFWNIMFEYSFPAAFGRLCVETPTVTGVMLGVIQPPSGGCVLKLLSKMRAVSVFLPAAFGRLCVETPLPPSSSQPAKPAAFGRLCVETSNQSK